MHRLQLFLSKLLLSLLLRLVPLLPLLFGKQSASSVARAMAKPLQNKLDVFGINASPNRLGVSETWKTGDSSIPSTRMWKISWPALTKHCNHWKPLQLTEKQIKILNGGEPKRTTKIEYHPLHQVFKNFKPPTSDAHWNNTGWYHSYHLSPFTYAFNGRCPSF